MGFEPTTSSMPSRRAPSCATAPPSICSLPQAGFAAPAVCLKLLFDATRHRLYKSYSLSPEFKWKSTLMTRVSVFAIAAVLLFVISVVPSLTAQQQGPIAPPPSSGSSPGMTSSSSAAAPPSTHAKINGFAESPITTEPPSQPVDQIVQKMA